MYIGGLLGVVNGSISIFLQFLTVPNEVDDFHTRCSIFGSEDGLRKTLMHWASFRRHLGVIWASSGGHLGVIWGSSGIFAKLFI